MKKVLSVILCAVLLLGLLPFAASAETVASGECGETGDNIIWTLDGDGTLTVTGSGEMKNYAWDGSPWYQDTSVKVVRVEEGITHLGDYAFCNCEALSEAYLPESLTSIGKYAFCGCAEITEIVLPDAVTEIGSGAFYDCAGVRSVTVPAGVSVIDSYTFSGCEDLKDIALPEGLTSIGSAAFTGCVSLAEISFPSGVTELGNSAFYDCKALTEISLPDRLASVGPRAFSGCTALREVTFGAGFTAVTDEMFLGCTGLKELPLPKDLTGIGNSAFSGCTGLTAIALPEGLTEIGESAFSDCTGVTALTLPESLTKISDSAFSGCTGLTVLTLPESITEIGDSAFSGCTGLTALTLPEGLTEIGAAAFAGCAGLEEVSFSSSVTSVGKSALKDCDRLMGVIVPDGIEKIGAEAFPAQAVLYGSDDSYIADWAAENNYAFVSPTADKLTLTGPAVVSERIVNVCGFSSPGTIVSCSVNGREADTVTAALSGKWNAALPLDEAEEGDNVTVSASVTAAGETVTREISVQYLSTAVAFREITLEHNSYAVTVTADNLNIAKPNVTLAPDLPFSFRVAVTNSDSVRKLYVVSTKKEASKKLELYYHAASDCWFADGFFDSADHSYVPGALTIEGRDKDGNEINVGVTVKLNFLKDPAGFAYEAVRSNHLADVTAAVYYKDEAGHELLWNAAAAEQRNPVPTLQDGAFSWAVTKGTWQIRLSKDGYRTACTEWMTVPPAQDQVFLPMVTTEAPTVENLNVYKDRAEIRFNKYMDIDSVNGETVSFVGYSGTIEAVDAEETQQNSGVFYAKTFCFTPERSFTNEVNVTIAGVKNYAGIVMAEDYSAEASVTEEPGVFTATDAVALTCGESAEISVSAENAAGKTVTVCGGGNIAALSDNTLTLDENGEAKLTVTGRMTGRERLTFLLDGTALTAATEVRISIPHTLMIGDVDLDGGLTSGDARLALRIAVGLETCEEGSDVFLAADINNNGDIGSDDARMILRASVGLETLGEIDR